MESQMLRWAMVTVCLGVVMSASLASARDAELERFQGKWRVIELVENGKVIPEEVISEWLPSGGRFTILEGALEFTSNVDGKKHVKLFSIDETQSPKGIDLQTREKKRDSWGIYRFDGDQLVVCLSDPEESERPTSFSAKEGSNRMLLTLERVSDKQPTQSASAGPKAPAESPGKGSRILTDAESAKMLIGTWRFTDALGSLVATMNADGTFSTAREMQELRLMRKTFVQVPTSSGTWVVKNSQVHYHVTASTHLERLNHTYSFALRSFSDRDMIYIDPFGSVGRAVRLK